MLADLLESGQISTIVGPHTSREKSCLQGFLSIFPDMPDLSLNFFFRSFLRKWRDSFAYEKACKNKTLDVLTYTKATVY
jgi:hypothetical protein